MRQGTARAPRGEASEPAYYEWKIQENPLSIHISFAVIDQLEADIMKGFWSVPKRGAEVGGVLFGRTAVSGESTTVYIEDYEPVPCEYRRGPSYVLSEADRKRLDRTLRKGDEDRQVVGFYRSHTRLGLYLDQDDYTLLQSCFANPTQVVLLVRPHASKTSVAGFFFWEEGGMRRQSTYLEFPFSSAEILKLQHGVRPPEEAVTAAAAEAPAGPETSARPPAWKPAASWLPSAAAMARRVNWRRAAMAAALVGAFALGEYQIVNRLGQPAPAAADYSPVLRVERNGGFLQVNWNRRAPSVLNARRGVLYITDGANHKELHFDAAQLREGTVAYSPAGNDVSFRLELMAGRTTVSESLRVVDASAPTRAAAAAAPQPKHVAARPTPAPPTREANARRHRKFFDDGL